MLFCTTSGHASVASCAPAAGDLMELGGAGGLLPAGGSGSGGMTAGGGMGGWTAHLLADGTTANTPGGPLAAFMQQQEQQHLRGGQMGGAVGSHNAAPAAAGR
jgi:hypothetical protein